MKSIALIVNPFASGVTDDRVDRVERELGRVAAVRTVRTERPGHAVELARDATADADAIVVFSGDGGFNEVLNGIDRDVPVGFLPGGGSSVLPRALGLPRDPVAAARRLAAFRTRRISVGRVNGRRFGFTGGLGLDGELVRRVDARGRAEDGRRPGDVYFAWSLARMLLERRGRFEPTLEIDGLGRAAFALVANAAPYTYFGRLPIRVTAEAAFDLGLDIFAPVDVRVRSLPTLLAAAVRGRVGRSTSNVLYGHDLDSIEIRCDAPTPLQADGEDLGNVTHASFTCEREAVRVLV